MPIHWLPGLIASVGAACVALVLIVHAPAVAAEDPAWPDIRADYRSGRYELALQRLEQLLRRVSKQREAYYYQALIYWRLQRYEDSARAWHEVHTLDPQGPFGQDAVLWLATLEELSAVAATPRPLAVPATASPSPSPVIPATASPSPAPALPVATPVPKPLSPAPTPVAQAPTASPGPGTPWLQAQPNFRGSRARSRNAKPGHFKALDGTFEFVPPMGFALLDEGDDGGERRALFGLKQEARTSRQTEQPPTLLMVWRDVPELRRYRQDQRSARARQLLMLEAASYGPGAKLESRFGVQTVRIAQRQGTWSADTWLFFQAERLYAFTYGGETARLSAHAAVVQKSFSTVVFYP
jgi:hypothetical protein